MELIMIYTLLILMTYLLGIITIYVIFEMIDFMIDVKMGRFPQFMALISFVGMMIAIFAVEIWFIDFIEWIKWRL